MDVDRPAPGEELNTAAEPSRPRQAATVILLRGGDEMLEVLLVKRNPEQRFMGGAWVFPGGAVDAADGENDDRHRIAGVREVAEEAGVELPGPGALVKFSRWITPREIKIRFDTHFFLAEAPAGAEGRVDGAECVDLGWFTPQDALSAHQRDEIMLVFPTIKTLEQLAAFGTVAEALDAAGARTVTPVEPRVVSDGEQRRVVLPGEPGYEG
jgi:8-oxo-dGTP pyrophosphatase MutT (NUDIX family)